MVSSFNMWKKSGTIEIKKIKRFICFEKFSHTQNGLIAYIFTIPYQ